MPTQMGSTAVPFASFRITMGMLVTGSIISPRIFISTSIGPSLNTSESQSTVDQSLFPGVATPESSINPGAHQAVRPGLNYFHIHIAADPAGLSWKINRSITRRAAYGVPEARMKTFHHHFKSVSHQRLISPQLYFSLAFLERRQPPPLCIFRHIIRPTSRGRNRAG